jgi:hypothetical protein
MNNQSLIDLFKQWCDKFDHILKVQMDERLSKIFMYATILEMSKVKSTKSLLEDEFMYKLLKKRANYINLKMNQSVSEFLAYLSKSPGIAVMYLYYLKSKVKDEELTMNKLTDIFPEGFPPEESLEELWNFQKIKSENLLDLIELK